MAESPKVYRELSFSLLRPAARSSPARARLSSCSRASWTAASSRTAGWWSWTIRTDRVSASGAAARAERYRGQLECYAWAMETDNRPERSGKGLVYFLRPGLAVGV